MQRFEDAASLTSGNPWAASVRCAPSALRGLRAVAWLLPLLLPWRGTSYDMDMYGNWADAVFHGAVPYRDLPMEYPPLAVALIVAPRLVVHSRTAYTAAFIVLMACCDAVQRRWVRNAAGVHGDAAFALSTLAVAVLYYTHLKRFDPAAALCTTVGLALLARAPRSLGAWAWLALAASLKVYAVALAPVAMLYSRAHGVSWRRLAAQGSVATAVGGGILAAAYGMAGAASWGWLTYHQTRGLHLASTFTAARIVWEGVGKPMAYAHAFGTLQVTEPWAQACLPLSGVLALAALGFTLLRVAPAVQTPRGLWRASAAVLVALLLTSKVFSPQYMVWLVPLVALGCCGERRFDAVLGLLFWAACLCTAQTFPAEGRIALGVPRYQVALVGRSGLLLAMWIYLLWSARTSEERTS